jgi:hypothetical protein
MFPFITPLFGAVVKTMTKYEVSLYFLSRLFREYHTVSLWNPNTLYLKENKVSEMTN